MAMAKRMRSLASVLWDTDLEASDQEGYQIQEVDAVQKTRRLEKENADLGRGDPFTTRKHVAEDPEANAHRA